MHAYELTVPSSLERANACHIPSQRKLLHKWGAICDILSANCFVFALNNKSLEYPESHAGASTQPHAHALARTAIEENLVLDIVRIQPFCTS